MSPSLFIRIKDWQNKTFPHATALSKVTHLAEEVKELHHDIATDAKDRRLEYADCFLLLFGAAASDGMSYADIMRCIEEKLVINKSRQWGTPDGSGVVRHIKQ